MLADTLSYSAETIYTPQGDGNPMQPKGLRKTRRNNLHPARGRNLNHIKSALVNQETIHTPQGDEKTALPTSLMLLNQSCSSANILKATPRNGARRFGKRSAEARSSHRNGVALIDTAPGKGKIKRMKAPNPPGRKNSIALLLAVYSSRAFMSLFKSNRKNAAGTARRLWIRRTVWWKAVPRWK